MTKPVKTAKPKICKDCREQGLPLTRPALKPGPRCFTHHNERKRAVRLANHGRRVQSVYGISQEQYWALYEYQGGKCAICRRATGAGKRLAVDHDHSCCAGPTSCGNCVRGLVCSVDNDILAHFRDDPEVGIRVAQYLTSWPSKRAARNLPWPPQTGVG